MKRIFQWMSAGFLTLMILCSWNTGLKSEGEKIVVNLNEKGAEVPSSFYGVFFEEINHAGDGGLYAELVQNRSFEDGHLPEGFSLKGNILVPPQVKYHLTGEVKKIEDRKMRWNPDPIRGWSLQVKDPTAANIKITDEHPFFETAPHSLEVSITDASEEVAVVNSGFWGMNIEDKGTYFFRSIIRVSPEYKGKVEARLITESGQVLATCPIATAEPGKWNDVQNTLISSGKDAKAKLAIVFKGTGKVWLDYVSLFPEDTYKGRKNGLRKDIAQMIADLKPSFVRWPGGTIVGGITLDTRMNWKKMLGDPAARPGEIVTWGYRCSYGLGYYEMLQYCEDIGADFMFVCNVGLGDQYRMGNACPEDSIGFYINDCLDAIEYAIGDKSTTWGARRAADGHPEPFSLKYVEVGNEHWGEEYKRRFALFRDAIKERYPQLLIIYDAQEFRSDNVEPVVTDYIDPHFYDSPKGFYRKNNFFDNHPRGKYRIYVGEYACNSGVGSGNMAAALSEAAFIDGMERNADLVTMTSFAPLLENANDRRWPVNLIRFNSAKVIGRSSYYIQKMASENRPTYNVWNSLNEAKNDSTPLRFLSSGVDESTGELILKFVNGSNKPYRTDIQLKGISEVEKTGKIITLASRSDKDENSFEEPKKIYPVESVFHGFGDVFTYEFAPFSYTILRIPIASTPSTSKVIHNGIPWFDNNGNIVNAHGACIVEEKGRYYLFGEWKSDKSNAFPGFSCYSSDDLVNWKFENVVLPMQKEGILGPNRVGERVKVMKCPATGEFVMYFHADDMRYKDPHIGYATCKTIAGDYEFKGALLHKGEPIRKWDMGTFKDSDGTGYLLIHHGIIYRLSDDYRSAEAKVLDKLPNSGESPAMFKKGGLYYMLYSGLSSWEKNDNFYFTAPAIEGPWTYQGLFAPKGTLTFNSQTTFVFPLIRGNDTIPMFMGDRWSYPHQASAATYVWMPMQVNGEKLSIPEYWEAWDMDKIKPVNSLSGSRMIPYEKYKIIPENAWKKENGLLVSNEKGSKLEIPFYGSQIAIKGETNSRGGYAKIAILNKQNEEIYSSLVDFYSKKTDRAIRFISPEFAEDDYILIIEVTGIIPEWFKKNGDRFGSSSCYVTVEDVVIPLCKKTFNMRK